MKILFNLIPELKLTPDGILLKQNRIVKQHRNIELPHENHSGTAKMIILLREKNYFVNTEAKVKTKISKCVLCAAVSKRQSLEHSTLPPNPWHTTEIDFHTILTPIFTLSVVQIVSSKSANCSVSVLEKIFSEHGPPTENI